MISFCRIDDRLIHGQVVTTWANAYKIEQIIVLNDEVANDNIQKNILRMAAPSGIKVQAFEIEKFGEILTKTKITRNTMLLFVDSIDVLRAINAGIEIKKLNIGGMRMEDGRTRLTKAVSVTPEEKQAFKDIIEKGIQVNIQMVPKDELINLEEVIYND